MKIWMRALALALALLMGSAALAENMTLPEKIANTRSSVSGTKAARPAEEDARRAVEYLLERGAALFANEGGWTDEEAVAASQAVTYLEQACARVGIAVDSPVVRLCSAMRTAVEQLCKQGLAWEDSGVASYAVAFEAAREELEGDMDGNIAALCDRAAALRPRWSRRKRKRCNGSRSRAAWRGKSWKRPSSICRSTPRSWKRTSPRVSDEVAEELTRALVCVKRRSTRA